MKISLLKKSTILVSGLLWQVACFNNADRNNPLDPRSDKFENVGSVTGQTLTIYKPSKVIDDVEIKMEPGPLISMTDSQGQFTFTNIPVGKYYIWASKEGYTSDFDSLIVQLGQTTPIEMNLDGLPIITSQSMITGHISRWWPQNELFLLEIMAQVEDPDGLNDIELVQIQIPELNFLDTLEVTQNPGMFRKNLTESQLPGNNLQNILGRNIFLYAQDRAGSQTKSPPNYLVRIIEQTPVTESPQGLEILQVPRPLLIWKPITLSFRFSFRVEVVRIDQGINNTIWTLSDIDYTTNSVTMADSLVTGTYFWTISVVDEFGNWSRSKEASFRIN
ncbi:MAG: hypothetical protein ACE5JB_15745 [bacterium]